MNFSVEIVGIHESFSLQGDREDIFFCSIKYVEKQVKQYLPFVRLDEFIRVPLPRLVVLNLNRAGTTLAAESRASNVITHAATIIKPMFRFILKVFFLKK